eukprot:GSA25T00022451001.1
MGTHLAPASAGRFYLSVLGSLLSLPKDISDEAKAAPVPHFLARDDE